MAVSKDARVIKGSIRCNIWASEKICFRKYRVALKANITKAGEQEVKDEALCMPKDDRVMDPLIASIVKNATGLEIIAIDSVVGHGITNQVVMATTPAGRLVVRLNDERHLRDYEKEAWCLKQAGLQGILVPDVIACGVEGKHAYSMSHYIDGIAGGYSNIDHLRVWKTLGDYASKLNTIPIKGFGSEMQSDGCFRFHWAEVAGYNLNRVFRDSYWEDCGVLTHSQASKLKSLLEECARIQAGPGICHVDISCGNTLLRNGNYDEVFMLDLEFATAAPVPHYQLACVAQYWGFSSEIMAAFCAGYGLSEARLAAIAPDVKRFTVLQSMESLRWTQDHCPKRIQEYTENAKFMIFDLMGDELG